MPRPTPGRPAFSLIEVLAVLSIIVVIVGMMLPALHSTREAARRSQCLNNMRQVGLAVSNYETNYLVLPPGVVDTAGPISDRPIGLQISWTIQLLPFIEQRAIYEVIDTDYSVYEPANMTAAMTRINCLTCPSDPSYSKFATGPGRTNYAGCHNDVEGPIDVDNHGVFYLNSSTRRDDLTDGAATTIFFGEKLIEADDSGIWTAGNRSTLRNTGTAINAATVEKGQFVVGGFGSRHLNGANFAFGDGSVRFLSDLIDPKVYRLLGHRSDGEMIDELEFLR